jgi:hypothetical protein
LSIGTAAPDPVPVAVVSLSAAQVAIVFAVHVAGAVDGKLVGVDIVNDD